jgi:hypothetical protein
MDRRSPVDARLLVVGAALAGLLSSQACVEDRDGPKSPNVKLGGVGGTSIVTGSGGGAGLGGSTGQGGGGNVGTGGSVTGVPDNCACIVNLSADPACSACQNAQLDVDCGGVDANCEADEECTNALDCLTECGDVLDPGPCIEICLDIGEASAELAMDWVDCVCDSACPAECDGGNTTCEPGTGGAGGMSGAGGDAGRAT